MTDSTWNGNFASMFAPSSFFGADMASAMSVPSMFFGTPPKPVNYKPKRVVFVEGLLAKVYFDDDSVFIVNCLPEDEKFFSEEIATALAIQKKIFHDSKSDRSVKKYIDKIAVRHPRTTEKEEKPKKKEK